MYELKEDGFYIDGECLFLFDYIPQEEIEEYKKEFEKIINYQEEIINEED